MYLCGVQYYLIIHGWNELERVTLWPLRVPIFRQRCLILFINSLSASLLLNIFLSFEVGIAHAIANFK